MENKLGTKKTIAISAGVTLILTAVIFLLVCKIGGFTFVNADDYKKAAILEEKYEKLYFIQDKIEKEAYFGSSTDQQMDAAYKAMVKTLGDKYSEYFNPKEAKEWENYVDAKFYGIGVVFSQNDKGDFVINEVIDESPAKAAGLKKNDLILEVEGKTFKDSNSLKKAIQGEQGSSVKVTYSRDNERKTVSITRGEVKEITVKSATLKNNIGYIRISTFAEDTAKEFKKELASMEKKNVKGVVIDLRSNGGGYADQGIKIADMILPEGTITYIKDKKGKKTNFNSDENTTKLKYVLLTDKNSASTSEIVTGAVKDNKGGKIVGTRTYGKGVMQAEYPFKDGSALKITTHQFFTPKGNVINKKGIEPDYVVELDKDGKTDNQLEKAMSLF